MLLDALSHLQEAVHGSQSSGEDGLLGLLAECEIEGDSSAKALLSLLERLKVAAGDALNSLPQAFKSHPGRPGHSVEAGEPATTAVSTLSVKFRVLTLCRGGRSRVKDRVRVSGFGHKSQTLSWVAYTTVIAMNEDKP